MRAPPTPPELTRADDPARPCAGPGARRASPTPPSGSTSVPKAAGRRLAAAAAALAVAACGGEVLPGADDGPGRAADDATEVVLLGTSHFAGSLTDENTSEVGDLLSERRQAELDAIAERISDWGPDELMVECTPDAQPGIDSLYRAYRAGDHDPTARGVRNEIQQLGFRAADRAGLDGLRCVDAEGLWLGPRAREVAKEHNPRALEGLRRLGEERLDDASFLADHTLGDYLLELNSEPRLWENHKAYAYHFVRMGSFDGSGMDVRREGTLGGGTLAFGDDVPEPLRRRIRNAAEQVDARVMDEPGPGADYVVVADRRVADAEAGADAGADTVSLPELNELVQRNTETFVGFPDHHVGADLVGEWYKRNLRIYANLWRAVREADDRVMLLVGQGHVWTLRTFLRENPDFEVVPVDEVL
jgi:hypothetical protein